MAVFGKISLILGFLLILVSYFYVEVSQNNKILIRKLNEVNNSLQIIKEENIELKNELNTVKKEYEDLLEDYKNLQGKYQALYSNYTQLSEKYKKLYEECINCKNKLKECQNKIKNLEYRSYLERQRKLFLNENFNYDFSKEFFLQDILNKCVDKFTLNFACSIALLRELYNFTYSEEAIDSLEAVQEFLRMKKGDCEDWSLFAAALINYLKDKYSITRLILFKPAKGSRFILYEHNNVVYYYNDAEPVYIDLTYYSVTNIICYYVFNETRGHCIVALSNEPLNPLNLNKTEIKLIEPQTGEYLGDEIDPNKIVSIIINPYDIFYRHLNWNLWK